MSENKRLREQELIDLAIRIAQYAKGIRMPGEGLGRDARLVEDTIDELIRLRQREQELLLVVAWMHGYQSVERVMALLDCSEQEFAALRYKLAVEGGKL